MSSIIERMTGFKIKSDFFSKSTNLEVYPSQQRVAILYGKNGCGKTTIAQGFRQYRDLVAVPTVEMVPTEYGRDIPTADIQLGKFFIFDEEYISAKVKLKEEGMDAIVLFGEQIDLDAQISKTENDIAVKTAEIDDQIAECTKFASPTNVNSPNYWKNQIRNELKKDTGWAGKGSKIKGQRQNLSVTDEVIESLGQLVLKRPQSVLQEEFDQRYKQYLEANSDSSELPKSKILPIPFFDVGQQARELLTRVVNRPCWTEREMSIFSLLGGKGLDKAKSFLANENSDICDKCLQPISKEYRTTVLQEIDSLLNRDVEAFMDELEKLIIPGITVTAYDAYRKLPTYGSVRDCLDVYNQAVSAHNNAVNEKISNPFDPKEYDTSIRLKEANDALNHALHILEEEKSVFNQIINQRKEVAEELLEINDALAHCAIQDMYGSLKVQLTEKSTADALLQKMKSELKGLNDNVIALNAQRKNFMLAVEEINHSLEYIFYCKERLSLELGSDRQYHLKVNGHTVAPSKVSCGERNALALSYFFTEIAGNTNASAVYTDEVFLVIDDPVSSFDFENRVGVQSLLRWKLSQVLEGCVASKVLILTHDIGTALDLEKGLKEIKERLKGTTKPAGYKLLQLENCSVSDINSENYNEYSILLQRIFVYAKLAIGDELAIGNIMRRVLEAFATFSYKEGIEKISLKESILKILPESFRDHFRNLMYRLVLNGESHYKEQVCGMRDFNFSRFLSVEEKKRTAKEILSFMYLLNQHHVLAHLPADAEDDIKEWVASIGEESESKEDIVK